MIDIHTHLYFPDYDADRDETIRRAFDAGVEMMISVSTSPEDHQKALSIAEKDDRIFASVGLHPHTFNEQSIVNKKQSTEDKEQRTRKKEALETAVNELRELAMDNPKIVAIGECGLDYFSHTDTPITDEQKAWQKEGFEAQIRLAKELNLPMIIHCRDAYDDMYDIVSYSPKTAFILHCYMGDTEVTKKFLELPNVYFSFTGNITYPVKKTIEGTQRDIRETVKLVPLDRLLIETDCPFLAPMPYRGQRNEPAFVIEVIRKIAEIKGYPTEAMADTVSKNGRKVFGLVY